MVILQTGEVRSAVNGEARTVVVLAADSDRIDVSKHGEEGMVVVGCLGVSFWPKHRLRGDLIHGAGAEGVVIGPQTSYLDTVLFVTHQHIHMSTLGTRLPQSAHVLFVSFPLRPNRQYQVWCSWIPKKV